MKPLATAPSLTEQAYQAILDEICEGAMPAGAPLIQEQLARTLGVSRHPIQQAMALLKADGLAEEAPGRGLRVAELDRETMLQHYQIRAALDGLAARLAAGRAARSAGERQRLASRGSAIMAEGLAAVAAGSVKRMVRHDVELHGLIYEYSGNPLIARAAEPHWRQLRRVMGEVLRRAEPPDVIWRQHQDILDAVVAGDAARAEQQALAHVERAAQGLASALGAEAGDARREPGR